MTSPRGRGRPSRSAGSGEKKRVCENKDFDIFFIFRWEKKGGAFAVNDAWWVGRRKKGEEGRAEGETLSKFG